MTAPHRPQPPAPNGPTHYDLLGVHPSASPIQIRRCYRELSKRYHPDTTELPPAIATAKFQALNAAYAILSNPERRALYDRSIRYSSIPVIAPQPPLAQRRDRAQDCNSAYLDATDRPLSGGELFALFSLGLSLVGCLGLVLLMGWLRGDPLTLPAVP